MKLDEYEKEILESVENDEWKSKKNINKRKKELERYIKNQKKQISVILNQNDLLELKRKAAENTISYNKLIQVIIHKYVSGEIEVKI